MKTGDRVRVIHNDIIIKALHGAKGEVTEVKECEDNYGKKYIMLKVALDSAVNTTSSISLVNLYMPVECFELEESCLSHTKKR